MTIVDDARRKRPYRPRPSRRTSEPTRPYAIRLGGVQADWLDQYLADLGDFDNKTQKLSHFVSTAIQRESGIKSDARADEVVPDMDSIKDELKRDLKKWVMRLLNDRQRFEVVHEAHNVMADGGAVDDAVIDNILQGFEG